MDRVRMVVDSTSKRRGDGSEGGESEREGEERLESERTRRDTAIGIEGWKAMVAVRIRVLLRQ